MLIDRMRLSGFKSFVEPAELKIEPGLTGIVGPNGCGKSNLLEALRWVMGENSPKSMRGGGMEDVIFAGTETRPRREFAEVMLSGESGARALDASAAPGTATDMEVVRRIERGAGSAYRLNGRDVRAKDISLLFADAATGAHSPALVSQGRVAAVIAAKPEARRQMLEEAAGISGLHVRRKDAETRLRAAENNLEKLAATLSDMDGRIATLKRQARAAERYELLSASIRQAEARLIYARWAEAKKAADAARAEAEEAESSLAEMTARSAEARAAHEAAIEKAAEARAAHGVLRDAFGQMEQEILREQSALERVEDKIAALESENERLAAESEREDRRSREAGEARTRLESDIAALAEEIEQAKAEVEPARRALERGEEELRRTEIALAQAQAEEARGLADAKVASAALETAERRHARLTGEIERLDDQAASLGDEVELHAAIEAAQADRSTAEAEEKEAQEAIVRHKAELARTREAVDEAQALLSALRAEIGAMESERTALRRQLESRSGESRIAARMKAAPGYEAALAAALGEEAEAALGRLDSDGLFWEDAPRRAAPDPPGGVERLADHVSAPDALATRLAFIWVADAETGEALPPGVRLVTRDGSLRRWDGFAGKGASAALAQELRRKSRLDELDGLMSEKAALLEKAEADLGTCQAEASASAAARQAAETARTEASERLRAALRHADRLEGELAMKRSRKEQFAERRESLVADLRDAADEEKAARERLDALPDISAKSSEVAALRLNSEQARHTLQALQAEASASEQAAAALRERRAVAQADLRGWTARASEADLRARERGVRTAEIAEELNIQRARPESHRRELKRLTQSRDSQGAELDRRAVTEREASAALTDAERIQAEAAEKLASVRELRAVLSTRAESEEARRIEMGRVSGERFECPPPLLPDRFDFDPATLDSPKEESARLERYQLERERIGPVNLLAARELQEVVGEQERSRIESQEIEQAIRQLRGSIGALNREGRARLLAAFEQVNGHFQRLFTGLFGGGSAHLALIESDDPLEAGLEIMAQPPGKKLASLSLLSGGEQALTAVALIFGLFLTNPAPICVLDEVDAPLDDANIERFCDLLDRMVAETQTRYLIVTHNAVTMSRMHRLFGVTMIEKGISRLVSVDLGGAEELLAAE